MASSREANAFMSAFTQGFGVVDAAAGRRERQRLLEEELKERRRDREHARERQNRLDREREADRATARTEREFQIEQRTRAMEATALMSDPNVPDQLLQPYANIPEVASFMANRSNQQRQEADMATVFGQQVPVGAAPGAPATQPPEAQLQSEALQAAELPPSPTARLPIVSEAEINRIADGDPAAGIPGDLEQAAALREAREKAAADSDEQRRLAAEHSLTTGRHTGVRGTKRELTAAEKKAKADAQNQSDTTASWNMFYDINSKAGDSLRNMDPNLLTAKYHDDRAAVRAEDPDLADKVDKRMQPHVAHTIETQSRILLAADPGSPEARNSRRKLSEAYGVAQAIGVDYEPLRVSGVDGRGLPKNGTNEALTNQVVESFARGPGHPLPRNPRQTQSDMTMVQRGASGPRVSEKFTQAAYRLFRDQLITPVQLESLLTSGRLPGSQPTLKDHNPKNDLVAHYPDGRVQVVIPARDPSARIDSLRNTIGDDGLAFLNRIASAIDDETDSSRGTRSIASFQSILAGNEELARTKGYDLANINDVSLLYQRFQDMTYVEQAYNDEAYLNGRRNPDFREDYGGIAQALFDERIDDVVAGGELEQPGTTTLGFGGDPVQLTPLKGRNPAELQLVIDAGFAQTPEEAEALLQERGL